MAQTKGHYYRSYKWEDIANVVNAKRVLTVEGLRNMETSQLNFASTDLAKYLWRLCLHQVKQINILYEQKFDYLFAAHILRTK